MCAKATRMCSFAALDFSAAAFSNASNNVGIAFGTDAADDGALSLDEIGLSAVRLVGRGENIRSGEQFHVTATNHGITLRLK